jgi:formate-dependent nitrite reductase membrane component NrfD
LIRIVEIGGLLAALATMAYTGLLLWSFGTGILLGSLLVPLLFILSSLSTGFALLFLTCTLTGMERSFSQRLVALTHVDTIVIVLELVVLTALLILSLTSGFPAAKLSAQMMLSGSYALLFWVGVVVCGLIAPLALESLRISTPPSPMAAALLILAGGFCLRLSLVRAALPPFTFGTMMIGA